MMFFIFSKKNLIIACSSVFLGVLAGVFLMSASHADLENGKNPLTVIIDAGHGIPDGGAVGTNGTTEAEINLKIAKKLSEVLEAKDINVIMTRTEKYGLYTKKSTTIKQKKIEDMRKRLEIMKKNDAEIFISIHLNSFGNERVNGLHIFYDKRHKQIKPLAEAVQSRMADVTGAKMNLVTTLDRNIYLMNNPPIPVILIECGFLSNPDEEEKLRSSDYQARLAWAVADAVEKYYALQNTENLH